MADQWIVEFANRIAQHQPGRLLALVAATWLLAVPLLALLWLAVGAVRGREPQTLSLLALAAVGALASFGLHQLVDHLYFRPRPYWALPAVHAIGARRGDSSFFSVEAAIAAALACSLLLAARRWGLVAVAAALLVGLGQLATGANYPFDVLVGLAVGAACTAALLPLRHRLQRLAGRLLRTPVAARGGGSCAWASSRWSCWWGWAAGWSPASRTTACGSRSTRPTRALAAACPPTRGCTGRPPSTPWPRAAGDPPARVYAQVTYVNCEFDGDVHIVLKAPDGAFVVLEIIPELPIRAPHDDDRITAWGIVRHDGLHNWWELHPLVGWAHGRVTAPSTGGLDD